MAIGKALAPLAPRRELDATRGTRSTERDLKPQDESDGSGPVGQGEHQVAAGECVASIADANGHFWQTLWNHPANAELASVRKDPNVLLPGDRLTIPPIRPKDVPCATGKRHTFRRRGVPEKIKFVLSVSDGRILADKRYRLLLGSEVHAGRTAADGLIDHWVPTGVTVGFLSVWPEEDDLPKELSWNLQIGYLDPITTRRGVASRLRNLGFDAPADGASEERARAALLAFQAAQGLAASGVVDDATRARLEEVHDRAAR